MMIQNTTIFYFFRSLCSSVSLSYYFLEANKMSCTALTHERALWLSEHKAEIEELHLTTDDLALHGSLHNARYNRMMTGGGWGWWVKAFNMALIPVQSMPYWSGSDPTYSTAIELPIARYILKNAPIHLLPSNARPLKWSRK
jgi:hypothetical protein